jgi:phage tail-like protein
MPSLYNTSAFSVQLDGVEVASFKEMTGGKSESEIIEFQEVTPKGVILIHKEPGKLKHENLTLKTAIDSSLSLWDWRKEVEDGDIDGARRDVSIVLYDSTREEVARWDLERAWPAAWKVSDFNAGEDQIAVQEVTIAHEGFKKA